MRQTVLPMAGVPNNRFAGEETLNREGAAFGTNVIVGKDNRLTLQWD